MNQLSRGLSNLLTIGEHFRPNAIYHGPHCALCRITGRSMADDDYTGVLHPETHTLDISHRNDSVDRKLLVVRTVDDDNVAAMTDRCVNGYISKYKYVNDMELSENHLTNTVQNVEHCVSWLMRGPQGFVSLLYMVLYEYDDICSSEFWQLVNGGVDNLQSDHALWVVLDLNRTFLEGCVGMKYQFTYGENGKRWMVSNVPTVEFDITVIVIYLRPWNCLEVKVPHVLQQILQHLIVSCVGHISIEKLLKFSNEMARPHKVSVVVESNRMLEMESFFGYTVGTVVDQT